MMRVLGKCAAESFWLSAVALVSVCLLNSIARAADSVDLGAAMVVVRPGDLPNAETAAATVLTEEVEKRTGIRLETSANWPVERPVVAITSQPEVRAWGRDIPVRQGDSLPERRAEGCRLFVEKANPACPVVWIVGADARGALYGVGALLRNLDWARGNVRVSSSLDIATAPASPIRGHQLGYRTAANSWDAWDVAQFDQYIRELTFFGINSIENIPFQDDRISPVMKVPRREMNRAMSGICERYGLDYWVWTPAAFDLKDEGLRAKELDRHEELYKDCKELTGVFFPGGDPGDNLPELVLPFLEDVSKRLLPLHPKARVWLSLQGFTEEQAAYVFDYLEKEHPDWLGGLCEGPSSPPMALIRQRLPKQYKLRMYPDITHNKLCQYPVSSWDQAYALTLGREAINPRPAQYASIHNWCAPYCDGFISYSDGVHDDVNKTIWSAMSWDPAANLREVLVEYARVFFNPMVAEDAADGILALESNWRGALADNGAVEGTLRCWQDLEGKAPPLETVWRWQMCLVRAYYDAYVRRRLLNESHLEDEANAILMDAGKRGAEAVMLDSMNVLNRAVAQPVATELRERIVDLYDKLFHSVGLQSSVEKYFASGAERGASLDFIDIPLNNRWWLEDEFEKVRKLGSEAEKCARLNLIATWEHPGAGSFYDDVGNTAKSPHVKCCETLAGDPAEAGNLEPTFWWMDEGKCRKRLSWLTTMDWPEAVIYEGVDPDATYKVRLTGYGQSLLKMDGVSVQPTLDGRELGEFKEFPVAPDAIKDRRLVLTWDRPADEAHLNWRQQSRLAEVWLLKQDAK